MDTPTIGNDEILAILVVGVVWLSLVYIPARNAKRKGYNFWLAYVAGLFFWLPTLIIVAVLGPNTKGNPYRQQRTAEQKICPVCSTSNSSTATACTKCGMTFMTEAGIAPYADSVAISNEVKTEVDAGHTRLCPNCGRLNSPTRKSCKSCGAAFAV